MLDNGASRISSIHEHTRQTAPNEIFMFVHSRYTHSHQASSAAATLLHRKRWNDGSHERRKTEWIDRKKDAEARSESSNIE